MSTLDQARRLLQALVDLLEEQGQTFIVDYEDDRLSVFAGDAKLGDVPSFRLRARLDGGDEIDEPRPPGVPRFVVVPDDLVPAYVVDYVVEGLRDRGVFLVPRPGFPRSHRRWRRVGADYQRSVDPVGGK